MSSREQTCPQFSFNFFIDINYIAYNKFVSVINTEILVSLQK